MDQTTSTNWRYLSFLSALFAGLWGGDLAYAQDHCEKVLQQYREVTGRITDDHEKYSRALDLSDAELSRRVRDREFGADIGYGLFTAGGSAKQYNEDVQEARRRLRERADQEVRRQRKEDIERHGLAKHVVEAWEKCMLAKIAATTRPGSGLSLEFDDVTTDQFVTAIVRFEDFDGSARDLPEIQRIQIWGSDPAYRDASEMLPENRKLGKHSISIRRLSPSEPITVTVYTNNVGSISKVLPGTPSRDEEREWEVQKGDAWLWGQSAVASCGVFENLIKIAWKCEIRPKDEARARLRVFWKMSPADIARAGHIDLPFRTHGRNGELKLGPARWAEKFAERDPADRVAHKKYPTLPPRRAIYIFVEVVDFDRQGREVITRLTERPVVGWCY